MNDPAFDAIVIGGSAGALEALSTILPALPADFFCPILAVVHLPAGRESALAQVLQQKCEIRVTEARDKESIVPGTAYFAPPDYHLLVEPGRYLSLSSEEPEMYSRPSIDVLFESAADAYGPRLVGILLSGANSDGARGLRRIADEGGLPIVQSPEHSFSKAMPLAALELCPQARSLSAKEIATLLQTELRP